MQYNVNSFSIQSSRRADAVTHLSWGQVKNRPTKYFSVKWNELVSNAARCYNIGPGEMLKRRELGRGRGLVVRSAAVVVAEGQRRKMRRLRTKMRLRNAEICGRTPSASPLKFNRPLLDADVSSPPKSGNASSSFGKD